MIKNAKHRGLDGQTCCFSKVGGLAQGLKVICWNAR
jgi:hypothetical protein